jgi:branched-chain amino acid aminotransferase
MRQIWLNGKILPETEAKMSVYDSGALFADIAFEMTRSFNGIQFKLKEHIRRLIQSAKYLRIPLALSEEELIHACLEVQEANRNEFAIDDEHRLMINVTRGILGIYKDVQGASQGPNVIITDFPLRWTTAGMGRLYDTGIECCNPSQRTIPASLLEPKVKNRNRIHYLMANIEASQMKRESWALLLDPDGFVAECSGANFFIVKDGIIISPEPRNILRGISRDYIMECGIAKEKNIEPYDVYNADEAFVTATPFCILPVVSVNGVPIGDGTPGDLYKDLLAIWSADVGVDIKQQIQDWDTGAVDGTSPYAFK